MNTPNPIATLQQNASDFFDKVAEKNAAKMECKKGCSQCCMTDISVFDIEADRIREYVKNQITDNEKKHQLKSIWESKPEAGACHFLVENQCSIYEVRPVICRTQGLPLFLSTENVLDFCPLNFKDGNPEKSDWLNLERLNTMLSIAAKSAGRDERISLKKLKKELQQLL
jgi:Fe-S-cluster containining protein